MVKHKNHELSQPVIGKNCLIGLDQCHLIQLPPLFMNTYGDMVVVVKDTEKFMERVISAVHCQGGILVMGNVSYHNMVDRMDGCTVFNKESMSIAMSCDGSNSDFNANNILEGRNDVIHYGCLDKYSPFKKQKEWRICWLPERRDTDAKILHCGPMDDIFEFVPTSQIRRHLMKKYSGFIPGIIESIDGEYECEGTVSYREFMDTVEKIDGSTTMIVEVEKPANMAPYNFIYGGREIDPKIF